MGYSVEGTFICNLEPEAYILILYNDGTYITYKGQESLEVGIGIAHINQWDHTQVFVAVYKDGANQQTFGKRFKIASETDERYYNFISEEEGSKLYYLSTLPEPRLQIDLLEPDKSGTKKLIVNFNETNIPEMKVNQTGLKITDQKVKSIKPVSNEQTSLL